ncbi:D-alanyl-D-alanine carboxypeptidase [Mesonia phycicola]|uniref:D-alanyl-D-alanine carboxypeptidase n=1 Tax=Mesonia phycicola TaxID=579105 RepID=A0A1M6AFZ2_9FLAO|nr:M15 family metallopeptidase [Mesonia phycicola]SHI35395.1 D-alanyl-D-alanine carboxypeptidase [Mesonia phycicola]
MNRKNFIQNTLLGIGALITPTNFIWNLLEDISTKELLGKGSPTLYGKNYKLRQEAYQDFLLMKKAAYQEAGVNIQIVSSYRSFSHQKRIWNRKYNNYLQQGLSPTVAIQKIIEYSTIPGTSRHHWGTDIDIIDGTPKTPSDLLIAENYNKNGVFSNLNTWMTNNAHKYNFYVVYTDNPNRKGFKPEPWHFSYAPLSIPYLQKYKTLDILSILQKESLIGSEHFSKQFIQEYVFANVLDINPHLLG